MTFDEAHRHLMARRAQGSVSSALYTRKDNDAVMTVCEEVDRLRTRATNLTILHWLLWFGTTLALYIK